MINVSSDVRMGHPRLRPVSWGIGSSVIYGGLDPAGRRAVDKTVSQLAAGKRVPPAKAFATLPPQPEPGLTYVPASEDLVVLVGVETNRVRVEDILIPSQMKILQHGRTALSDG